MPDVKDRAFNHMGGVSLTDENRSRAPNKRAKVVIEIFRQVDSMLTAVQQLNN